MQVTNRKRYHFELRLSTDIPAGRSSQAKTSGELGNDLTNHQKDVHLMNFIVRLENSNFQGLEEVTRLEVISVGEAEVVGW